MANFELARITRFTSLCASTQRHILNEKIQRRLVYYGQLVRRLLKSHASSRFKYK